MAEPRTKPRHALRKPCAKPRRAYRRICGVTVSGSPKNGHSTTVFSIDWIFWFSVTVYERWNRLWPVAGQIHNNPSHPTTRVANANSTTGHLCALDLRSHAMSHLTVADHGALADQLVGTSLNTVEQSNLRL